LVIGLMVSLWAKKGKSEHGRHSHWLAGPAVMLLVCLLLLGAAFFLVAKPTRILPLSDFKTNYEYQTSKTISETPTIWFAGMEDEFEADVYPSQLAAVRGLGHRLKEVMQQYNLRSTEQTTVKLVQGGHQRKLLEELRRSIRDKIEEGGCLIVSDKDEVDIAAGEIGVVLNFTFDSGAPAPKGNQINYTTGGERGAVEAAVLAGGDEYPISVGFREKPWVENFADFMNRNSKRQWLLARSSETCSTAEKAHELGLADAARRISYILNGPPGERGRVKELIKVAPKDIRKLDIIVDKFPQSFRGSEGPIWREALLIDVSAPKLEQLRLQYAAERGARRRGAAYIVFSFAGMMGLICLLYAVVNAATKGYYTTVLRVMTVLLAIAVLAGLFMFLGMRAPLMFG